jgi:hypothetical protein
MKPTLVLRFSKHVAAALVLMVAAQMSEVAMLRAQEPQPAAQRQPAAQQQTPAQAGDQQTGKPGADLPQAPDPAAQPGTQQQSEQAFASSSQDGQPQDAQKPVGTAAGPYTRPSGVAGSRPAGAAIAPSKQKRKKSLAIRVGLIVGGAVAVGTVAGLSMASSSRP